MTESHPQFMLKIVENGKLIVPTQLRAARTVLAAMVLLALLSTAVPFTTLAGNPMCNLACCAGRAPHAAGSCMNGSCHAFLAGRFKTTRIQHQLPVQQSEQLCGLRRRTVFIPAAIVRESPTLRFSGSSEQSPGSRALEEARGSNTTLGAPCQADCGAGTLGSSSQNRPRESGTTSYADRPRPPSISGLQNYSSSLAKAPDALCRQLRPRGPPTSSFLIH